MIFHIIWWIIQRYLYIGRLIGVVVDVVIFFGNIASQRLFKASLFDEYGWRFYVLTFMLSLVAWPYVISCLIRAYKDNQ